MSASLGQIDIAPAANDTYAVHHQKLMIRIIRRKVIARRSIQSTMLSTHQFLMTMANMMIRQDKELTTNRDIGYLSCFLIAHQTTDSMHTPRRIGKRISTKGGNERQGNQCKQMNMSKCNKSTNAKLYKLNYFAVLHQFSS